MNYLHRLQVSAPKLEKTYKGRQKKGRLYAGLPGQGGDWKAHWNKKSLSRSDAYHESVRILDEKRAREIAAHNWKIDQMRILKEKRAMMGRSHTGSEIGRFQGDVNPAFLPQREQRS